MGEMLLLVETSGGEEKGEVGKGMRREESLFVSKAGT